MKSKKKDSKKKDSKKKDSKKKDSKKKKSAKNKVKQKDIKSPEIGQLQELTDTVKSMAQELGKLQKANKSLEAEIQQIKGKSKNKKEKAPKVVTTVMESQVLPPAKTKVKSKQTRKPVAAKSNVQKVKSKSATTAVSKAKSSAKPKTKAASGVSAKPAPKPKVAVAATRTRVAKKPVTPSRPSSSEDLRFVQGLGAKIESLLNQEGVKTFSDLAKATQAKVKSVLAQAGPRFKNQDPKPLIEQAKFIKAEKWAQLEAYQAELMKGKKKPGPKAGDK